MAESLGLGTGSKGLQPARRRGLTDEVADRLREAILDGSLSGGERIGEVEVSQRLDVSRGPVREALVRLEQEGLVTIEWHRGATVVELTMRDVDELASLRTALERLAVVQACEHATAKDLAAMRDIVDRMRGARRSGADDQLVRLDVEFHDTIYRAAQHERLHATWTTIRSQVALFLLRRRVASSDYGDIVVDEHSLLVDVLESGDQERAEAMIVEHLRTAYARLAAAYGEASTDHAATG